MIEPEQRGRIAEVLKHNALVLFALTGLGVAQPLLDLFGKNPEFFVAQDASRGKIVAFALAVTLLVPAVLLALEGVAYLISTRVGRIVHVAFVALLGAALALTWLRHLSIHATVVVLALAALTGVGLAFAERRSGAVRFGLRILAFAPLVFLGAFLLTSSSSRLIWEEEARAEEDVTIGRDAPVVELVFDEFPLASILSADGTINAQRFPNFARLAEEGSWFRNASSVSWQTEHSVPSILTGVRPAHDEIPSSIDHPRNLFTLLGGSYDMDVEEQITDLCPSSLCSRRSGGGDAEGAGGEEQAATVAPSGLSDLLGDAAVVYGHASLPPGLRGHLPSVGHSWGGFLDDGDDAPAPAEDDDGDEEITPVTVPPGGSGASANEFANFARWEAQGIDGQSPPAQGAVVEHLIDAATTPGAHLSFAHVVLPHFPWQMTPSGHRYTSRSELPSFTERTQWPDDGFAVRQAQQQHLLQVGYADSLIGELIDRMQAAGTWDDALVVVVADHGVSFIPGGPQRAPTDDNIDEIYRVPMFIKAPGQAEGAVRDDNAQLIDVLPTTVDALDLEVDWEFDGRSLISDTTPPDDKQIVTEVGPTTIPDGTEGLLDVVARNDERFGRDPAWRGVLAVGPHGADVGRSVSDLTVSGSSPLEWSLDQRDALDHVDLASGFVPILVSGTLLAPGGEPTPRDLLIAVNGTVAGVAGGFERSGDRSTFSALLAEPTIHDGANTIQVLAPRGEGGDAGYTLLQEEDVPDFELRDDTLVAGERQVAVADPTEDLRLEVESAFQDDQVLAIKGWGADTVNGVAPDAVLVFADGRQVAVATSRDRPDLEDALGADLPRVGFDAVVANASAPSGTELVVVALFGDAAVAAHVTPDSG